MLTLVSASNLKPLVGTKYFKLLPNSSETEAFIPASHRISKQPSKRIKYGNEILKLKKIGRVITLSYQRRVFFFFWLQDKRKKREIPIGLSKIENRPKLTKNKPTNVYYIRFELVLF